MINFSYSKRENLSPPLKAGFRELQQGMLQNVAMVAKLSTIWNLDFGRIASNFRGDIIKS